MRKELEEKLFNDFPLLYQGKDLPITQNLMPFGFEFSDGWYQLVYDLSVKLEHCIRQYIEEAEKDGREYGSLMATQAKEKFGGLRLYMSGATDEMYDLIDDAEELSYKTCEECGDTQTACLRGTSWLKTLCDQCTSKQPMYSTKYKGSL